MSAAWIIRGIRSADSLRRPQLRRQVKNSVNASQGSLNPHGRASPAVDRGVVRTASSHGSRRGQAKITGADAKPQLTATMAQEFVAGVPNSDSAPVNFSSVNTATYDRPLDKTGRRHAKCARLLNRQEIVSPARFDFISVGDGETHGVTTPPAVETARIPNLTMPVSDVGS